MAPAARPWPDPDVDGVVFVQLDGVPHPVTQWALQSGHDADAAALARRRDPSRSSSGPSRRPARPRRASWGSCTGRADGVPAFRWYDRELGRVLVSNRPADAAVIEARASTGRGLLADTGCLVSNLFSGRRRSVSLMTMSKIEVGRAGRGTPAGSSPGSRYDRTASRAAWRRTVAEVVRERRQASLAAPARRRRHACTRSWTFALLRAVSNGLLRDMNTAVVADEMMRGTRAVYVDYVDYDEVAHHAGGTELESLVALAGARRGARHPRAVARVGSQALPLRGPLRPRAVDGGAVLRAFRGGPRETCAPR